MKKIKTLLRCKWMNGEDWFRLDCGMRHRSMGDHIGQMVDDPQAL